MAAMVPKSSGKGAAASTLPSAKGAKNSSARLMATCSPAKARHSHSTLFRSRQARRTMYQAFCSMV